MRLPSFLSRVHTAVRHGAADPASSPGIVFRGTYEPNGRAISGGVSEVTERNLYPPLRVIALRDGDTIGATEDLKKGANGWRFKLLLDAALTADDILKDRLTVFAVDHRGNRSKLAIDGAVQLSYVRQVFAAPYDVEIDIDFSAGGNSGEYLARGWSGQEPEHIWTEGKESTIGITFAKPGDLYRIELLAWPFAGPKELPVQTVVMRLGDVIVGKFFLGPRQHLLECDIPAELSETGPVLLKLELPDATRPCDLGVSDEARMVALACKRLKLKHFHQSSNAGSG